MAIPTVSGTPTRGERITAQSSLRLAKEKELTEAFQAKVAAITSTAKESEKDKKKFVFVEHPDRGWLDVDPTTLTTRIKSLKAGL